MLKPRRPNQVPPGGKWFYVDPASGLYFESYQSRYDLLTKVRRYYVVNDLDAPDGLDARVDDYLCRQLPVEFCEGTIEPGTARAPRRVTYFEVIESLEKYFRGKDRPLATMREAEERALVCRSCPNNELAMCTHCNGLRSTAARFVRGRRLQPLDNWLGVCSSLKLPASALIHVAQVDGVATDGLAERCWVRHG